MADAEQTLRELLDDILHERDYRSPDIKVKAISSDGANYTSTLFLVDISAPNKADLKLFAKVAIIGAEMRIRMNADWLFGTERFVYTKLIKIYEDIQNECGLPEEHKYVFPKFYGLNSEVGKETVVMENLIESGYRSYNRFKSIDWEHARVSVENLAKFHALSFAFDKRYPEEFNEMLPDLKFRMGSEKQNEEMKPFFVQMINSKMELLKEEQREKVRDLLLQDDLMKKFNQPIGRPVISHGDYRTSNLLYRRVDDELEAIAVDYQTVHGGCPVGDLIYFIFMGSDEEFRRRHYQQTLDHYYASLSAALVRLSLDPAEVYPKEKFEGDLKQLLPYAVLMGVAMLPIVLVEAEAAPRVDGDADIKEFLMEPNELFAHRFRGLIDDCFRLGAIKM